MQHSRMLKKGSCGRPDTPGKGTKIVAIAVEDSLPLAVSVQSASLHDSQLVGSFSRKLSR
jgi:hypothetical protein